MTLATYQALSEQIEIAHREHRRLSVSGILRRLGLSRSGYYAWLHRNPSKQQHRKELVQHKNKDIHEDSYHNYGAPKSTKEPQKSGKVISERTVGKYM